MRVARVVAILALCIGVAGCAGRQTQTGASATNKIAVVTTISVLNSFVAGVGGNRVSVTSIVPVGASPETFQPTPQDVATVTAAQLLVENGAGLETWLDRLLANAQSPNLHVVACADGLPIKNKNPHLWMDPQLAKKYVLKIRDGLIAVDPKDAAAFNANAVRYNARLDSLTRDIQSRIDTIPPSHRYMIVFHNAWQYYNDRFGMVTLGFVERNPGQEPNPQQIGLLVDLAKQHGVDAVFSEPEYSPKLLHAIAQGAGIGVVESLYDDSVGTNPNVADYIDMLEYDTGIIVKGLK
ncbi:MAG TPA: metal ABC transporter substrate-binding protein [Candidatus Tumulicola sp.]